MFIIYQIRNLITDGCYIGFSASFDFEQRWVKHKKNAKIGVDYHLYRAMRKYGIENFSFEILEMGENVEYGLKIAEPMYISWLKPKYNMTLGGDGILGFKFSEEQNEANSLRQRGVKKAPRSKEHCENISKSKLGDLHPRPFKGKKHTEEARRKIAEWHTGRKHSEESKLKMSESAKKRKKLVEL